MQKSFEGILRSLITQILRPHLSKFRSQNGAIYQTYRRFQKCQERRANIPTEIEAINTEIDATRSELDNAKRGIGLPRVIEGLQRQLKNLEEERKALEKEIPECENEILKTRRSLTALTALFRPHSRSPTTLFLESLVAEYQKDSGGLVAKLESLLRLLLDQNVAAMDLVLFFDALDEFDGHISLIGRFLETIIQPAPTSSTRVKVCFSSRPSEHLQARFSKYPGFQLQDYTKHDIEEYAAGVLAESSSANNSIAQLVPQVLSRADGVFLWVRLSLQVLLETIAACQGGLSLETLAQKLEEIPDDLSKFYHLIIERISKKERRKTFSLLEILIRNSGNITAAQLRNAVLASCCATYRDVTLELSRARTEDEGHPPGPQTTDTPVRRDILTWGGGLVEITPYTDDGTPQLMHQTILEFATGLDFKQIVLGSLAYVTEENGHSFHMKYWSTMLDWPRNNETAMVAALSRGKSIPTPRGIQRQLDLRSRYANEEYQNVVGYHAQRSELTTGRSHYDFLSGLFFGRGENSLGSTVEEAEFVAFISSHGLNLCLRDWITRRQSWGPGTKPNVFAGFYRSWNDYFPSPIVSTLILAPPQAAFDQRYLLTMQLLLENGYRLQPREDFFASFDRPTWRERLSNMPVKMKPAVLLMLAASALRGTPRPSTSLTPFLLVRPAEQTAIRILRQGVDPNAADANGMTLLDWVVLAPQPTYNYQDRGVYELCSALLNMGARLTRKTPTSMIMKTLAEIRYWHSDDGLDVRDLLGQFAAVRPDCTEEALEIASNGLLDGLEKKRTLGLYATRPGHWRGYPRRRVVE